MTAPGQTERMVSPRSHRSPRQLRRMAIARRWLRWLGIAVALLLTLAAGEAIIRTEPDRNETTAPFFFAGEPGEPVTAGGLQVTLLDVKGAAMVDPPKSLPTDTSGVWLVVRIRLMATTKTTQVAYVGLAASDGRSFRATGRFRQSMVERSLDLQPGIPVEGTVAFEVPKDVTGLTLRVGEVDLAPVAGGQHELQPFTDIRLPVTSGDLARWSTVQEPVTIDEPRVVA